MGRHHPALLLLLAAACGGGPPAPARAPAPAPAPAPGPVSPAGPAFGADPARTPYGYPQRGAGIQRYALSRRDSVVLTMPTGETQAQILGRTAYLTLTWVAADTGTRLTAKVDSVVAEGGAAGAIMAALDSARGARWAGLRDPEGRLTWATTPPPGLVTDLVRDQLGLLFPALPPGGGVRPGATWADSAAGPTRAGAFEAMETALVQSAADNTPDQAGALPITVSRTRTASGEGTLFGQPISVQATGTDTLYYRLGADGQMRSATGRRVTDLVVDLHDIGQRVTAFEASELGFALLP